MRIKHFQILVPLIEIDLKDKECRYFSAEFKTTFNIFIRNHSRSITIRLLGFGFRVEVHIEVTQ